MSKFIREAKRWYDNDQIVARCIKILENIETTKKRKTATFLTNEIILRPPYRQMLPEDLYNLVMDEQRNRRWYDFDRTVKIFVELLRHSPDELRNEMAVKAIKFIEEN